MGDGSPDSPLTEEFCGAAGGQKLGYDSVPLYWTRISRANRLALDPPVEQRPARENPIQTARRMAALVHQEGSMSTAAAALGMSRARVSQLMALLRLAPAIQRELDQLDGLATITERELRPIATLPDQETQEHAFRRLLRCRSASPCAGMVGLGSD